MKRVILIITLAVFGFGMAAADASAQKKNTETVVFDTSITCNNCKKKLEENIPFEKGIKDMKVDVETKKVTVTYDPAKTDPEKIRAAIEKLGYKAAAETKKKDGKEDKEE